MADLKKRLPNNVDGDFFVDSTCINCDACRQLAPAVFADDGDYSYVFHQPKDASAQRQALHALLACPTHSIGTVGKSQAREAMEDFPLPVEDGIYYVGFNSEKSFGGTSYLIRHPEGNWLIDSPRFTPFLVKKFKNWGGIRYIFLTHRDDVADAGKYAEAFGSEIIIHERDKRARLEAGRLLQGDEPVRFSDDFLIIPTPGHTQGHCVLLYKNKFLFSGDHLWWSRRTGRLGASKGVCWYSWRAQTESMERLLNYSFEWVLPGHGRRAHYSRAKMSEELSSLVKNMKAEATA
jgi:glyoxylase-like metal-dependent hydrolase (beta-lactamase superfamily II)/ferredoxin